MIRQTEKQMALSLINIRLDRWLWAARFFKTRSQAAQAVAGGRVHINGHRAKPARPVKIGDQLSIGRGDLEFVVIVQGLADRRGPAVEARKLYEETAESLAEREREKEASRLRRATETIYGPARKPDKRERRRLRKFVRQID